MKLPYFKIDEAYQEVKGRFESGSNSEKLSATAKLIGKSVANVGMYAFEMGVDAAKNMVENNGRKAQELLDKHGDSMSEEQIERAKRAIEAGKEARDRRLEREREERERERQAKEAPPPRRQTPHEQERNED